MMDLPTVEQTEARNLADALRRRAARLRGIADEFDTLAGQVATANDYVALSGRATNSLAWGVANLSMEQLGQLAASAEVARAKGE